MPINHLTLDIMHLFGLVIAEKNLNAQTETISPFL